jgi:hypothetical protein
MIKENYVYFIFNTEKTGEQTTHCTLLKFMAGKNMCQYCIVPAPASKFLLCDRNYLFQQINY